MNIHTEINACTLHVVTFPDAKHASLSFGIIQVDRKLSKNPMNRAATVMRVMIFVVNGIASCPLIFKATSRNRSSDPIIDKTPPTLGMMTNALSWEEEVTILLLIAAVTSGMRWKQHQWTFALVDYYSDAVLDSGAVEATGPRERDSGANVTMGTLRYWDHITCQSHKFHFEHQKMV